MVGGLDGAAVVAVEGPLFSWVVGRDSAGAVAGTGGAAGAVDVCCWAGADIFGNSRRVSKIFSDEDTSESQGRVYWWACVRYVVGGDGD